jgi:cytochrome c biogenesis protein ResB
VLVVDREGNELPQTVGLPAAGADLPVDLHHQGAGRRGEQLAFEGVFTPTTVQDPETGRVTSVYPAAENPALTVLGYRGDLGLDDGRPQSVYQLEDRSGSSRSATARPPSCSPRARPGTCRAAAA